MMLLQQPKKVNQCYSIASNKTITRRSRSNRFFSVIIRLREAEKYMERHKESVNSLNNITINFIESQLRTRSKKAKR